jgi:hypothetical protein
MVLGVEKFLLDEVVFFHLSIASWRLDQTRYFEKGVVHLKLYTICLLKSLYAKPSLTLPWNCPRASKFSSNNQNTRS